jgi:hypothetical protein
MSRPLFVALSLVAVSGCSLISKGKSAAAGAGSLPSSSSVPSSSGVPVAPQVKPDKDDPPHVTAALARLDKMEKLIADKKWAAYAHESRDFQGIFLFHNGWADEKKHDAMKQRLDALDAMAFKAFGGRLVAAGDAHRILKMDQDTIDAAVETVDACHAAASMSTTGRGEASEKLSKAIAAYDKALARVVKMDPNALHYFGEGKKGSSDTIDVSTELMECEVQLVGAATQFADEYAPEPIPKTETEKGCGEQDWLADGVAIGGGQFAPYTRTKGGAAFVEAMACKKMPTRNKYPGALRDAVNEYAENIDIKLKSLVVVMDGKPYVEVDDEDGHPHRYQKLKTYSREFEFSKNPCGAPKLFCEGGGSQAMASYNRMEFAMERATAHAGENPELCKKHLNEAKKLAAGFEQLHTDAVKSKQWIAGATYRSKKGSKMTEKEMIASFATIGQQADDHLADHFCSKPQK